MLRPDSSNRFSGAMTVSINFLFEVPSCASGTSVSFKIVSTIPIVGHVMIPAVVLEM